jgi:hypothetical protein
MLRLREPGGRGTVRVLLQTRDYVEQKPLTPHDDGLDLWQAIPGVTENVRRKTAAFLSMHQCGSPNIVALPVPYEQGTRTYSSPNYWGSSQSHSAQGAAPPRRKGYGGHFCFGASWCLSSCSAPGRACDIPEVDATDLPGNTRTWCDWVPEPNATKFLIDQK